MTITNKASMKKYYLLMVAFFIVGNVASQSALRSLLKRDSQKLSQRVSRDTTIISYFNMGVYDVDEDCYRDSMFECSKYFYAGRLYEFNITIFPIDDKRSPAMLTVDVYNEEKPMKRIAELMVYLEFLKEKYIEWSKTAKENKITDFSKEIEGCPIKQLEFYATYKLVEKNTDYRTKQPFVFKPIFKVNDVGTVLLILEQQKKYVYSDALPYRKAKERGDLNKVKAYLKNRNTSDFFSLIGKIRFSSPEQIQSLIDALKFGLANNY